MLLLTAPTTFSVPLLPAFSLTPSSFFHRLRLQNRRAQPDRLDTELCQVLAKRQNPAAASLKSSRAVREGDSCAVQRRFRCIYLHDEFVQRPDRG